MNKMSFSVGTPLWGVAALDEREVGDAPPAGLVNSTGSLYLLLPSDVGLIDGLDVALRDVTRPYVAPSKQVPNHDA